MASVGITGVDKTYGSVRALEDVSFDVPAGSTLDARLSLLDAAGGPVADTDGDATDGRLSAVAPTSGQPMAQALPGS